MADDEAVPRATPGQRDRVPKRGRVDILRMREARRRQREETGGEEGAAVHGRLKSGSSIRTCVIRTTRTLFGSVS